MVPGPTPKEIMVFLKKEQGNVDIGVYRWENDGDVVEVDEVLGGQLLTIKGHDFTEMPTDYQPEPDEPAVDLDGDGVPDGTANQVMQWVGEDKERALQALLAEKGRGNEARSSLIARLEKAI